MSAAAARSQTRTAAVALLAVTGLAVAGLLACWQLMLLAASPSALLAGAAVTLAGLILALLAQAGWRAAAHTAGPLLGRTAALRRKAWGAAFQRQRDPDAAGHARPRAPGAGPAVA